MEDNNNYTYTHEAQKERPEKSVKVIFGVVVAALFVLSILLGVLFGMHETAEDETTTEAPVETSTQLDETTTEEPALYKTGEYSVQTGGYSLRFRTEHSRDAESITDIPDGTKLTVTDVYYDETAEEEFQYWGQVTYLGHTGWVTLSYLQKEYSDNVVTPEDLTVEEGTTEEATSTVSAEAETTTKAPSTETTTKSSSAETTTAASTTTPTTGYTAGDYKIATGGYTLTFRKSASTTGEAIMSIADGTTLSVVEVVDTGASNSTTRYWGKVTYLGHTGYVSMAYLEKVN